MKIQFDIIRGRVPGSVYVNSKITNVKTWDDIDISILSPGWLPGVWCLILVDQSLNIDEYGWDIRYYIDTDIHSGVEGLESSSYLPDAIRMYREQLLDELL